MHEQGLIGYSAFKNGVGIRIFLNRAVSSIGTRTGSGSKKILPFAPAAAAERAAAASETAFKDSFAVREDLDTDVNPHAPKDGADTNEEAKMSSAPAPTSTNKPPAIIERKGREVESGETGVSGTVSIEEIIQRLKCELEPALRMAAASAAKSEHERTREWLDKHGIPKATRVAQKEAYNVLRSHGLITASTRSSRADLEVGRSHYTPPEAKPLSPAEITELAQMCLSMLELHGQAIEVTLSEISAEAGGCLLTEDAPKVRAIAESMARETSRKE